GVQTCALPISVIDRFGVDDAAEISLDLHDGALRDIARLEDADFAVDRAAGMTQAAGARPAIRPEEDEFGESHHHCRIERQVDAGWRGAVDDAVLAAQDLRRADRIAEIEDRIGEEAGDARIDGCRGNEHDPRQIADFLRLGQNIVHAGNVFQLAMEIRNDSIPQKRAQRGPAGKKDEAIALLLDHLDAAIEGRPCTDDGRGFTTLEARAAVEQAKILRREILDRVAHHDELVLEEAAVDEREFHRFVETIARLGKGPE